MIVLQYITAVHCQLNVDAEISRCMHPIQMMCVQISKLSSSGAFRSERLFTASQVRNLTKRTRQHWKTQKIPEERRVSRNQTVATGHQTQEVYPATKGYESYPSCIATFMLQLLAN